MAQHISQSTSDAQSVGGPLGAPGRQGRSRPAGRLRFLSFCPEAPLVKRRLYVLCYTRLNNEPVSPATCGKNGDPPVPKPQVVVVGLKQRAADGRIVVCRVGLCSF